MSSRKSRKPKRRMRRLTYNLIIVLLFLVGLSVLLYPTISDFNNKYVNSKLIVEYDKAVSLLSEADYSKVYADAKAYNDQHKVNTFYDAFAGEDYILSHPYDTLLNPLGNETMGYIDIPKIAVKLAIGHGTSVETLEKGAGHIEGTSLPIGGPGTHSVISAHRGLPSAKLFTDLDMLKLEDKFFIHVLNETLAYEVDQIIVIEPDDSSELAIKKWEDLVTLLTCTPYGVNSHRLLVRGHRIPYNPDDIAQQSSDYKVADRDRPIFLLAIGMVILLIIILIMEYIRHRKEKRNGGRK